MFSGKTEVDIIRLYDSNLMNMLSIHKMSLLLNKAYPAVNRKVNELIRQNVLKRTVIGRSHLCSLNLNEEKTLLFLFQIELMKKEELSKDGSMRAFLQCMRSLKKRHGILTVFYYNSHFIFVLDNLLRSDELIQDISAILQKEKLKFPLSRMKIIDSASFEKELVSNSELFSKRVVLLGYEYFFSTISDLSDYLQKYNPLLSAYANPSGVRSKSA